MNNSDIDICLLQAILSGEKEALAQLYERHSGKLLWVAYNILNNREDAEDLLHDLFLEVWQKAKTYSSDRGSVVSWLMIRMRCRAIDRKRALAIRRKHKLEERSWPDNQTPGFSFDKLVEQSSLGQALSALTQIQRNAVLLCYFQGFTYQEIAHFHGLPIGTVKSRIAAAVKKLGLHYSTAYDSKEGKQ